MIDPAEPERAIADASRMFEEAPSEASATPSKPLPNSVDISYDLEAVEPPKRTPTRADSVFEEPRAGRSHRLERGSLSASPLPNGQVWTRLGEWGPALIRVGLVVLIFAIITWQAYQLVGLTFGLMLLFIGSITTVLVAYPIIITLERPVRFTPEQAVRDYYGALSNIFPHHRRMWLLLSSKGRDTSDFSSLTSFRNYWREQVFTLGGTRWSCFLRFQLAEFKSDKGGGQSSVEATYRIVVSRLGSQKTPIATREVVATLSRGADRMWYLDEGRLTETTLEAS